MISERKALEFRQKIADALLDFGDECAKSDHPDVGSVVMTEMVDAAWLVCRSHGVSEEEFRNFMSDAAAFVTSEQSCEVMQ